MKLRKPAGLNPGRKSRKFILPLLLLASLHSQAAFSASLNVKIRQLKPDGAIQQVTCTPNIKCLLPIDIQTGTTKETLTVHVLYVPGNVLFEFETSKGYLYAGEKTPADKQHADYETIWHHAGAQNKPSAYSVTLFLPLVAFAAMAPILDAVQQSVADLEITTEQQP